MKRTVRSLFLFFGISFAGISCLLHASDTTLPKSKTVWLTVFVHGIMSIKPHISCNNFVKLLKDDVKGSHYEKSVELMREDPFFYKNQAMQKPGFHEISPGLIKGDSSAILAHTLKEIENHYGINQYENIYYTFGWSGLLSAKCRYQEAQRLYDELSQEVKKLKAKNINPRIRIFGYSHGGNVGLNLARIRQDKNENPSFSIDELILLGSPVIKETDYLVNDPLFKKVYNLYSLNDRIQPLDLFAPKQLFSNRVFRSRKGFSLPDKLVQIQLKVTRCKRHISQSPERFVHSFNFDQPKVLYGKKGLVRDSSPGHVELWFFSWTPEHYRSKYPLNPLPTVAFAPIILHHAKKITNSACDDRSLIADIRPQNNIILFRPKSGSSILAEIPYLPQNKIRQLHEAIHQCKPAIYSTKIYKAHVKDAITTAKPIMRLNDQ